MKTFSILVLTLAAIFHVSAFSEDTVSDGVDPAPIVQGMPRALALDAAGNRYITGSFYDARDFNPNVGADIKTPTGWTDLYVTRFNADGSYAWTATLGASNGSTQASALVVANGVVYVAGAQNIFPNYYDNSGAKTVNNAIVAAFDSSTGKPVTTFATNGIAAYSGPTGAQANALILSGKTLFAAGEIFADYSQYYLNTDPVAANSKLIALTPESHAFVWSLDATNGKTNTAFGTSGVTQLSDFTDNAAANSIALTNGALYVAGTSFASYYGLPIPVADIQPTAATSAGTKAGTRSLIYYGYPSQKSFVAALDPTTGALNAAFGSSGILTLGSDTEALTANAIAASSTLLYVTGARTLIPQSTPVTDLLPTGKAPTTSAIAPAFAQVNSDAYILALDPKTGTATTAFGTSGMVLFGRQFDDSGAALALDGNTLYITGAYGNLTSAGYDVFVADAPNVKTPGAAGLAPSITGAAAPTAPTAPTKPNNTHTPPPVLGRSLRSSTGSTTSRKLAVDALPFYNFSYSITDAFVLALDATTGAPVTSFSTDGVQTFGGTDNDAGTAIAVFKGQVIVAGTSYSTDAGIGGPGKIDASDWYGFVLALDTATGGGGGTETNRAPIVKAAGYYAELGQPFEVKLAQNPSKYDDPQYDFNAWLSPTIRDDGLPNPPGALTIKWEKVSGPGTVKFADTTKAYTAVKFPSVGQYVLKLTVSDSVLSASDTLTVSVTQNNAPVLASTPTVTPSSPTAGSDAAFAASATDKDGDDIYYWWDFGDGDYGWDATPMHTYLAPGTYTVHVYVSDGTDETESKFNVTVTGDPIFQVDDCEFIVDFNGKSRSRMSLKGSVGGLPKDFKPENAQITLTAAGAQASFTLDAKGRATNSAGTFALKKKKGAYTFTARINSANIETPPAANTTATNALGLSATETKNTEASVPVALTINGVSFNGARTVKYSTAKGMAKGR